MFLRHLGTTGAAQSSLHSADGAAVTARVSCVTGFEEATHGCGRFVRRSRLPSIREGRLEGYGREERRNTSGEQSEDATGCALHQPGFGERRLQEATGAEQLRREAEQRPEEDEGDPPGAEGVVSQERDHKPEGEVGISSLRPVPATLLLLTSCQL